MKHYDWGGKGNKAFLRRFLGSKDRTTPFAEAWYGTHPQGPSRVAGTEMTLQEYLYSYPKPLKNGRGHLTQLPFMVKIIDAQKPLSLQVHPNKAQAVKGFRRENAQGLSSDSPSRCFRDRNPKPEVLMPLGSFDLLAGFLPSVKIEVDSLCVDLLNALFGRGERLFVREGVGYPKGKTTLSAKQIATKILALTPDQVRKTGSPLFESIRKKKKDPRLSWLLRLWDIYGRGPGDPATLLVPFLEFHRLRKGECMVLLPGTVHTYLKGSGLEIMGCSDNVLRLGLTSKTVDSQGGLSVLRAKGCFVAPCAGKSISLGALGKMNLLYRETSRGGVARVELAGYQVAIHFPSTFYGNSQKGRSPSVFLFLAD